MSTITQSARPSTKLAAPSGARLATAWDYAVTYALSGITAICGLTAFRLASYRWDDAGFAEYAITRRAIGFLTPLLSLGLAVALARCVARHSAARPHKAHTDQLGGALLVAAGSTAAFMIAVWAVPDALASLVTGLSGRADLVWALTPPVAYLVAATVLTAYCRGRMWIGAAGAIQLVCIGLIPNVVLLAAPDIGSFLRWSGYAGAVVCLAVLAMIYWRSGGGHRGSLSAAWALLREGAPRAPGDLAFYGLLAAPAIVAAKRAGLHSGGEVAYALALLTLVQTLVAPLSMLLLPEASYLILTEQTPLLRRRLGKLLSVSLPGSCALVAVVALGAEPLIRFHLGACSPSLATHVRWFVAAAIPLNFFFCVRSVIDAGERRAVAPAACLTAFTVFGSIVAAYDDPAHPTRPVVLAFLVAMAVLAMLSGVAVHRVLRRAPRATVLSLPTDP